MQHDRQLNRFLNNYTKKKQTGTQAAKEILKIAIAAGDLTQ